MISEPPDHGNDTLSREDPQVKQGGNLGLGARTLGGRDAHDVHRDRTRGAEEAMTLDEESSSALSMLGRVWPGAGTSWSPGSSSSSPSTGTCRTPGASTHSRMV